ncbi:PPA1309 family protein [Saccharopolyspora taberi]|uniref:PPA1309 family protein n=1 Tax=Saccharopolyspora taberi TaxID=60895 RepID=A0ABN3VJZ3_9PSEU
MSSETGEGMAVALRLAAREIEEFVATAGWDQPTQVFALVPTRQLLAAEPGLADQLDPESALTPIAQESLPADDLADALARISWPDQVAGCAIVQEIVVLPPEAEAELPTDGEQARQAAAEHPERREARLVAAVLREGGEACVMRLRGEGDEPGERIEDPSLAPNLLAALSETFED